MKRFIQLVAVLGLLLGLSGRVGAEGPAAGARPVVEAKDVKAAYIYNFTKFIEWAGEDGVPDPAAAVVICVVGSDPVGMALDAITSLQAKGRPILVHHVKDRELIPACHILYIGTSEAAQCSWILARVGRAGVLTVSDIPRFAEQGGMIGFGLDQGRVRIEINALLVRGAGLKVSSKLLEVARIVPEEKS